MELKNLIYKNSKNLESFIQTNDYLNSKNLLIQIFTSTNKLQYIKNLILEITTLLPNVKIIGSTTSGEISSDGLHTNTTILSFCNFENTKIATNLVETKKSSFTTGQSLIKSLNNPYNKNIKLAICLTDGLEINGEEFLKGVKSINSDFIITGGMAGDYLKFEATYVFTEKDITKAGAVIATLENPNLKINTNYNFNWEPIGKKHIVTEAKKNRVYKIDNKITLDFYKEYLGDSIEKSLPDICIELPLIIEDSDIFIARAVIKIHDDGSFSYAGNIDEKSTIRFAYGNTELILNKSKQSIKELSKQPTEALFIYSCIGRKTFLEEKLEAEIDQYSKIAPICGFLTNGEFFQNSLKSKEARLLNQTTIVLAISESNKNSINTFETKEDNPNVLKLLAFNHLISKTTNELEDLTINLEKRVKEEVAKNNEKDLLLNIIHAQAEVGYMLEMIAHQWRQPLSAISTLATTIQLRTELGDLEADELKDNINEIVHHTYFANETIDDFSKLFQKEQKREEIELYKIIDKVKNLLKPLIIKHNIHILENYLCEKNLFVSIQIGQLTQVFMNIIKNSIDAIVENKNNKKREISITINKIDNYYTFTFEDNAGGISKDIIGKIFDKRFSTKEKKGTGIGLNICKSILEKNIKGEITASNGENGAIFKIKIPIRVT